MTTKNIEWLIGRLRAFSGTSLAPALMHQAADTLQSQAERIKVLELDLDVQAGSIGAVQAVNTRQAERIKVIERESEMRRVVMLDVMLESDSVKWLLAERIKELEGGVAHWKALREAAVNVANDRREERDTLRAQLSEIAATEPVLVVEKEPDYWSGGHFHEGSKSHIGSTKVWRLPIGTKLFTCPMPVQSAEHCLWARNGHEPCQHVKPSQDVTELVEALEKLARLGNGEHYGNSDGNMIARTALSKYKGAK